MSEKQYYTAIDLGTTNSVIAYGNIQNNVMRPIVLELDRKNDMGSKSRNPLLPSVVFYYKNNEGKIVTDIGDYAKSRYGTRAGYVCKSVKSLMGTTDQVPLVEEIPDKTPSDVSAQILSFMINSAKKRLFQNELSLILTSARQPLMLHEKQESMSKTCTISCSTSRRQLFMTSCGCRNVVKFLLICYLWIQRRMFSCLTLAVELWMLPFIK